MLKDFVIAVGAAVIIALFVAAICIPAAALVGHRRHRVTLYEGGELVQEWIAVGKVYVDGGAYRFTNEETGRIVLVSGVVVID